MQGIVEFLLQWGYFGLFIGSFLAATIIPFSSDLMLLGMLAIGGDPVTCVMVATLGNWLGGMTSYGIGRAGKWEWIEKWFKIKQESIEKHKAKIDRYGSLLALFTWLPLVGDVMAIGLGFYRINFRRVTVFMLIGKCARYTMWALAHFLLSPLFS